MFDFDGNLVKSATEFADAYVATNQIAALTNGNALILFTKTEL